MCLRSALMWQEAQGGRMWENRFDTKGGGVSVLFPAEGGASKEAFFRP